MAESRIGGLYIEVTARAGKAIADLRRVGASVGGVAARARGALGIGGGLGARSLATFGTDLPGGGGGFAAGANKGLSKLIPKPLRAGLSMGVGGMAGLAGVYAAYRGVAKLSESIALVDPAAKAAGESLETNVNNIFDNFAKGVAPMVTDALKGLSQTIADMAPIAAAAGRALSEMWQTGKTGSSKAASWIGSAGQWLGKTTGWKGLEEQAGYMAVGGEIDYKKNFQDLATMINSPTKGVAASESAALRAKPEKLEKPEKAKAAEKREGISFTTLEGLQNELIQRQNAAQIAQQQLDEQRKTNALLESIGNKEAALK